MSEIDVLVQTSDEALYILIMPMILVWVLTVLIQPGWPALAKTVVAGIAYAVAAIGYLWYTNADLFEWHGVPRLFLLVAVIGQGYYRLYRTGLSDATNRSTNLLNRVTPSQGNH